MGRRLTADRLAARLARMGGARLSAEEYDAGDDLLGDDSGPAPIHDATGKVDMEKLLADLLRALGIHLPENIGEKQFKIALYEAAIAAISSATGRGAKGGTSSTGATNPLIPGGAEEVAPMYLSLGTIEQLPDAAKQIALSLATECDRLNFGRREAAKAQQRLQEASVAEARSARQAVVNRILAINPMPAVRREVEDLLDELDRRGAAFSTDAANQLLALERRVNEQLVQDRQPCSA